jgi:hypothetical protein
MGEVALMLPLVAAGGVALALLQSSAPTTKPKSKSEEEWRNKQQLADLEQNGATASFWQNQHNKTFLMGNAVRRVVAPNVYGGGVDPDLSVDPLLPMFQDHNDLAAFDRKDTIASLYAQKGEVRMRRRMPIAAALTPEIHRPGSEEASSTFLEYKFYPDRPNAAQIAQAQREIAVGIREDQQLRNYYGVPFFARAPGQSFRYSDF